MGYLTVLLFLLGILLGIILGRIYGWMKYRYPEFQAQIELRVSKLRAERMKYEAQTERYRSEIDDEIERRMA
jgi:hypothetical protein